MSVKKKLLMLMAAAACAAMQQQRRRRRYLIRPFLRNRKLRGDYYVAVPEMISSDPEFFFETFRMTPATFETLLSKVGPQMIKFSRRESICPAERLQMTIVYLATGDQQKSVAKDYRVGRSTICEIIHETTLLIYNVLKKECLAVPTTDDWLKIANDFEKLWQFPHCIGALDGKHFCIPAPPNSGTTYFNYKGYFSIVLLATCDATYNFTTISIGSAGSESDAGIFGRSKLAQKMSNGGLGIPEASNITETPFLAPYVFVGDEAFPLQHNLMKPFGRDSMDKSTRVFNYRLSRARRIIENTFGILVTRWRLLLDCIHQQPEFAETSIKACIALHNYLRKDPNSQTYYCPAGYVDSENPITGEIIPGSWRLNTINTRTFPRQGKNNYTMAASQIRNQFKLYFCGPGSVPWQDKGILNC